MGAPLAFLITFRTYGTWLHGDARGSFDRSNNTPGEPPIARRRRFESYERGQLRQPPLILDDGQRACVDTAVRALCEERRWELRALNVRTNHVHAVIGAPGKPEPVMGALKARATRELRRCGLIDAQARCWSRHGSTRYLWNEESVALACAYVLDQR
jgi:REP element-mobilizing transposase RayT